MNSTLHHGLRLLEHLAASPTPVALSDLSRALGLAKSQAHRLLHSLVEAGYVVQDSRRRYAIGLKVMGLTGSIMLHHPLRLMALPVVRAQSAASGLEVVFSVLSGGRALVLATDHPEGRVRDPFAVLGQSAPLHAWANGKVLLAFMPLAQQEALLAELPLPRYTPRTITDRARLVSELRRIRQRGWALNNRENQTAVTSVSVPVFDDCHRCIAALGASWPLDVRPTPATRDVVVEALQHAVIPLAKRSVAGLP
ncbi:MAG: IclR family transcriptional regulator [Planctomycetota bacterium]|jgi:DNA-binding IclR family transcriptional regulator|nr:IclR family transcriptional regulator [Planctomycetota bacterium]